MREATGAVIGRPLTDILHRDADYEPDSFEEIEPEELAPSNSMQRENYKDKGAGGKTRGEGRDQIHFILLIVAL